MIYNDTTFPLEDHYSNIIQSVDDGRISITAFFSQWDAFSQWHPSYFEDPLSGEGYISCEHYMMSKKATLFSDDTCLQNLKKLEATNLFKKFQIGQLDSTFILSNSDCFDLKSDTAMIEFLGQKALNACEKMWQLWKAVQRKIKSIGRLVRGFSDPVWNSMRELVVQEASYFKYTQNKPLLVLLAKTKGTVLVEAAENDSIWGVGLSKSCKSLPYPRRWNGLNLLGKTLTNLRAYLTKEAIIC